MDIAEWSDLYTSWSDYHNKFSEYPSSHIDIQLKKWIKKYPCDENSGFTLTCKYNIQQC